MKRDTQGECPVTAEAEIPVMQRQAKEHQGLPSLRETKKT